MCCAAACAAGLLERAYHDFHRTCTTVHPRPVRERLAVPGVRGGVLSAGRGGGRGSRGVLPAAPRERLLQRRVPEGRWRCQRKADVRVRGQRHLLVVRGVRPQPVAGILLVRRRAVRLGVVHAGGAQRAAGRGARSAVLQRLRSRVVLGLRRRVCVRDLFDCLHPATVVLPAHNRGKHDARAQHGHHRPAGYHSGEHNVAPRDHGRQQSVGFNVPQYACQHRSVCNIHIDSNGHKHACPCNVYNWS